MEIDVTELVEYVDCSLFSASAFELGEHAAQITWQNAMGDAAEGPLVPPEYIEEARDYIKDTGGWTEEEVDDMSDQEINALVLQFVASAIREYEKHFATYEEYIEAVTQGRVSGNLWRNDDGTWAYCLMV